MRWAVHNVKNMRWMFYYASAFDQDLTLGVDDGVAWTTFESTCAWASRGPRASRRRAASWGIDSCTGRRHINWKIADWPSRRGSRAAAAVR